MNEYITFDIKCKTKREAEKVFAVLQDLTLDNLDYKGWLDFWKRELLIDKTTITVDNENLEHYLEIGCSSEIFLKLLIPAIVMQLRQKATDVEYEGSCLFSDMRCAYQAFYDFNHANAKEITCDEGCGFCPACDEQIVWIADYDPEETYYCPVCGEPLDHKEMFGGTLPAIRHIA